MRTLVSLSRITTSLLSLAALAGASPAQRRLPPLPPSLDAAGAVSEPGMAVGMTRHAIWMPAISSAGFVFAPPGRLGQDRKGGTARLTGTLVAADARPKA